MGSSYLNLCRLCAGSCEKSVPIFERTGSLDFPEKIKCYLHVEIKNSNDIDEPRMCSACYEKIINWDQYAEQVHKAQGMFMSLTIMKESNNGEEDGGVEEKAEELQSMQKRTGRRRMKKMKRVKSVDSEFSEEDEVPLANHLEFFTEAAQNRLKEKEMKKVKPRIKLKIKTVKEEQKESQEEENMKEGQGVVNGEVEEEEEEEGNNLEEDVSDSKSESKNSLTGLQSLFTWECLECHAPVKNWNALVKHCKEIHESNASVQCVCGKFLQSRASIMKHRMKHTIGYGYKCEFENCNKTFHRQQLLDVHSLSHMPKELQPWMCCKCSRRFHTESLLKQHEKVHLPKEEKLIHPCEVCQKKFCSKSAVSAHIRAVHFGERPFVCDQCGHSFTSKGILHEHLTIHSDVYNFHCKDCNKSFKTKYRLKIHMDTHVETRYQCPICTLTLNTRRTLRMHLLVHRDDKAFQCTTCGKAFKRSKDLKNHYNLHTGRRPYTCPFCQRTFANGSNCRSHKRRMHPEELKMYEAALAAGQQPIVFRPDNRQRITEHPHFDDSNESKSDVSELKYDKQCHGQRGAEQVANGETDTVKSSNHASIPLNLQRDQKSIKEEENNDEGEEGEGDDEEEGDEEDEDDEDEVEDELTLAQTVALNGDENMAGNATQMAFGSQSQHMQYPVHNFYTFQSSGIPAFPGNPFFRQ